MVARLVATAKERRVFLFFLGNRVVFIFSKLSNFSSERARALAQRRAATHAAESVIILHICYDFCLLVALSMLWI
jgi:hypothetical protein